MQTAWTRFLLIFLPCALVGLLGAVELASFLFRESPLSRHPLDRLVLSLRHDVANADIVLMGDSVTQDVAGSYRLGAEGGVANLTTNKASGIVGVYFLLQRYLANNQPPKALVLAATPEFLGYIPEGATGDVYLSSVFTQAGEQEFLSKLGLVDSRAGWMPAILSIDTDLSERVVGTLFARPTPLTGQGADIDSDLPVETHLGNAVSADQVFGRAEKRPGFNAQALDVVSRICALAAVNEIDLHVVWAPMPASVYSSWRDEGVFARLEEDLKSKTEGQCSTLQVANFNVQNIYPDIAFRDPDHLRRPGWTNFYADELDRYMINLPN